MCARIRSSVSSSLPPRPVQTLRLTPHSSPRLILPRPPNLLVPAFPPFPSSLPSPLLHFLPSSLPPIPPPSLPPLLPLFHPTRRSRLGGAPLGGTVHHLLGRSVGLYPEEEKNIDIRNTHGLEQPDANTPYPMPSGGSEYTRVTEEATGGRGTRNTRRQPTNQGGGGKTPHGHLLERPGTIRSGPLPPISRTR